MEVCITWNVCRVCLQEENKQVTPSEITESSRSMKPIFDDARLAEQIGDIAGIKLSEDDGLPQKICRKCLEALKYAVSFRNTCRSTNEYLHNIIIQTKMATSIEKLDKTRETLERIEDDLESLFSVKDIREASEPNEKNLMDNVCKQLTQFKNNGTKIVGSKFATPKKKRKQANAKSFLAGNEDSLDYDLAHAMPHNSKINLSFIASEETISPDTKAEPSERLDKSTAADAVESNNCNKSSPSVLNDDATVPATAIKRRANTNIGNELLATLKQNKENNLDYAAIYETALDEADEQIMFLMPSNELKKEIIDEISIDSDLCIQEATFETTDIELLHTGKRDIDACDEYITFNEGSNAAAENSNDGIDIISTTELDKHTNSNLRRKMKKSQRGSAMFPNLIVCEVCGNYFSNRSLLNYHMRTHLNERRYECELCQKRFNASCNLTAHMRTHTGEKPFQCYKCDRRFADRSTHIKHERTHTTEKPYKCFTCGKSFSLSTTLKAHERVHSGEKPFNCDICSKSFKLPHQLKAHLKTYVHFSRAARKLKTDDFDSV